MSLRDRMSAIVGDENTVARYLLEKVGHTALIAWTIVLVLNVDPVLAAVVAALGYNAIGKAIWHATHGWSLGWADARDFVFDLLVGLLPAMIAIDRMWARGVWVLCGWALLFLVLDNNAWGSPS